MKFVNILSSLKFAIKKICIWTLETKMENRLELDLGRCSIGQRTGRFKNVEGETTGPGVIDKKNEAKVLGY